MARLQIPFEEIPFHAFQKRLRNGELGTPNLNEQNRLLYPIPSAIVQREAFMADRESVIDSFQGESRRHVEEGSPFYAGFNRGRKRKG